MKDIKIKEIKDGIFSCNSCGARTYVPSVFPNDGKRKVDTLYELRIGNLCIALCDECLAELADNANRALKYGPEE